eukprot:COSAG04_NODE_12319_length_658_cov_1.384615_1_plen_112_part_00
MQASAARRLARTARHMCAGTAEVPVEQPPFEDTKRLSGARTGSLGERDPESAFGVAMPDGVELLAPISTLRNMDPPGADELGLSPEEIAHFREHGCKTRLLLAKSTADDSF